MNIAKDPQVGKKRVNDPGEISVEFWLLQNGFKMVQTHERLFIAIKRPRPRVVRSGSYASNGGSIGIQSDGWGKGRRLRRHDPVA